MVWRLSPDFVHHVLYFAPLPVCFGSIGTQQDICSFCTNCNGCHCSWASAGTPLSALRRGPSVLKKPLFFC